MVVFACLFLLLITEVKLLWSARPAWAIAWLPVVGVVAIIAGLIAAVVGTVAVVVGLIAVVGMVAVVVGLIAVVGMVAVVAGMIAVVGTVAVVTGMMPISPLEAGVSAGCGRVSRCRSPITCWSIVVSVAVVAFSTRISSTTE